MAPVVIAAAIPAIMEGVQMIAANQTSQAAKGKANATLATAAAQPFNEAAANSKTAAVAKQRALGAATADTGQSGTILTGPRGAQAQPSTAKTLLGL